MRAQRLRETYEGATVVVTGATSGNGRALAKRLLALGADVIALGRNEQRLAELRDMGAKCFSVDLSSKSQVDYFLQRAPRGIDFVFHLAGNAVSGRLSVADEARFRASDLIGPLYLIEGLKPRISPYSKGTIAVVTSESAALDNIPEIETYQRVKRDMVSWWQSNRKDYNDRGINLMLISMGAIGTSIWQTKGIPPMVGRLTQTFLPGPERYVDLILSDAMNRKDVSYPGLFARLAPVVDGRYQPHPVVKAGFTLGAHITFALFPIPTEV